MFTFTTTGQSSLDVRLTHNPNPQRRFTFDVGPNFAVGLDQLEDLAAQLKSFAMEQRADAEAALNRLGKDDTPSEDPKPAPKKRKSSSSKTSGDST